MLVALVVEIDGTFDSSGEETGLQGQKVWPTNVREVGKKVVGREVESDVVKSRLTIMSWSALALHSYHSCEVHAQVNWI